VGLSDPAMAFFTLLAALILESARPLPWAGAALASFRRYADRLAHDMNAGKRMHGTVSWFAAVCPWALAALIVFYLLNWVSPALGWVWTVAVLCGCIGFRDVLQGVREIFDALRAGDVDRARGLLARWRADVPTTYAERDIARAAIEIALVRAHREVFGVIFWFILLPGPAGALLYRLSAQIEQHWGRRGDEEFAAFGAFSRDAFRILDWIPVRLSAIGFAIAGNFEDAVSAWRTQARAWIDPAQGIVLASGAGALGVRLGGPTPLEAGVDFRPELGDGDEPDAGYLQSTLSLLWRTLIAWLVLLLLLTLARWVGG
jgi:cobalamin biosynthesis protein CobD/CbiB